MSFPAAFRALSALAMILIVGACTFDSANLGALQCSEEGSRRDGQVCLGGYWTATGVELDAMTDTEPPIDGGTDTDPDPDVTGDADVEPDVCIPADDLILCSDLGLDCGQVPTTDNCGNNRTLFCGECLDGDICHEDNRCACASQSVGELCALNDAVCGVLTAVDACGRERTVQCGPCTGENQTCIDNQCCQGESNAALCDTAPAIECGTATFTDSCGVERTVNCGTCAGEGAWQNDGAPYPCCSDDGADTCQCQNEIYVVPDCADNTCTTRVDDTRTSKTGCSACVERECTPYSLCSSQTECGTTGTRTRTCYGAACSNNACNPEATSSQEEESCTLITEGNQCTLSDGGSGICDGSGQCTATPCAGTIASCGLPGSCTACVQQECDEYTQCTHATDCATTGSRTQTCYTLSCSGTTCQNTPFERTDINGCNRSTTGDSCTLADGGTGECDGSGQCTATVTPCDGTITSCGEPGACDECNEPSVENVGDPYPCCNANRPCQCQDVITKTYSCVSNSCTEQTSAPTRTLVPDSCAAQCSAGSNLCKEFEGPPAEACCIPNNSNPESC